MQIVDTVKQKFYTVEGNAERHDKAECVAFWEYSFSDIKSNSHPIFLGISGIIVGELWERWRQ